MSYSIPVIQQLYDGHQFRSRLEARFAFFWNRVGLSYEYEPRLFEFPLSNHSPLLPTHPSKTIKYEPDFYLPSLKVWIEVKPKYPKPIEIVKAYLLAKKTQQSVFIVWNPKKMLMVSFVIHPGSSEPCIQMNWTFKKCLVKRCGRLEIVREGKGGCSCGLHSQNHPDLIQARRLCVQKKFD